jgi:hypothetical protein
MNLHHDKEAFKELIFQNEHGFKITNAHFLCYNEKSLNSK